MGRKLIGEPDTLEHYAPSQVITDNEAYPALIKSKVISVDGIVFAVDAEDFNAIDKYEGKEYKRIVAQLKSGREAWVYIKK